MRFKMGFMVAVCLLTILSVAAKVAAEDYYVIPFDVDPPIAIDGKLDDWDAVTDCL